MVSVISNKIVGAKSQTVFNQKQNSQPLRFTGKKDSEYINPVSRKTEKTLAAAGAAVFSTVVGTISGFVANHVAKEQGSKHSGKWGAAVGIGVGLSSAAITMASAIYNAGVNSFVRQKGMDVFSREKSVETGISEQIDKEPDFDTKLDGYVKYKIGKNGKALMITS